MSEPTQKCQNNAICKHNNYTIQLFIALNMAYYCCISLEGNLDFLDFLQLKVDIIDSCSQCSKTFLPKLKQQE